MSLAFVHRLRARYAECDPQGVVFSADYITDFDLALTEPWREAIGPYGEMVEAGTGMLVARRGQGEVRHVFVDMASGCPILEAVRRGLEPYLPDPELEGLARSGAGTARDRSPAP